MTLLDKKKIVWTFKKSSLTLIRRKKLLVIINIELGDNIVIIPQ